MGRFRLEIFKMGFYVMFPLTSFLAFNRPELFGINEKKLRQEALDKAMGRDMEEKRHFVPPRDFTLRLQELQDKRTTRETTKGQDTD